MNNYSITNNENNSPIKNYMLKIHTIAFSGFIIISFLFSFSTEAYATIYNAVNNGHWNNTSTWGGSSVPSAGDTAIIDGYEVSVSSDESCKYILVKSDNHSSDTYLRINSGDTLTVTTDIDVKTVGNNSVDINLFVYGTLNISGDLNYERSSNNTTTNELRLYIQDGTANITGDFNYNFLSSEASNDKQILYIKGGVLNCTNSYITQASGGQIVIGLRQSGEWNVSNNLTITRNNSNDFKLSMHESSSVNVEGNFLLDQNNCIDVNIYLNDTSSINTDGDFTIDYDQSNDASAKINIKIEDQTLLRVKGSLDISLNDVDSESHNIDFIMYSDAKAIIGIDDGNFAETSTISIENGGHLLFDIESDAQFIVYGDATFKSDGNGDASVDTYMRLQIDNGGNGNGLVDIKRNCTINANLEDWDHLKIDMNGAGVFNIDSNLIINNNTNISHTQIVMEKDAKITVGNDFNLNHSSKGDIQINMNNNDNGSAAPNATKITTGNDFNITANHIRNFTMDIRDYAEINTGGNFDISIPAYSTSWGDLGITLSANSAINVNDDFSIDNNGGSGTKFIITMEDNSQINTGSSGNTSDLSLTQNGQDDFQLLMANNTSVTVYGDFTFNKKNSSSVDATIVIDDNSKIKVYKNLVLVNENNSDLVYVDLKTDNAILNVRGNIDLTNAAASDRILIQAEGASNIYLGGSILRSESPNRYGSLKFSTNGTMHYDGDGTYGQQTIAENTGDGTDSVIYQNIIINNTSSAIPQLSMGGIVEIYSGDNLTLTDGIVQSSSTKYFSFLDGATVSDASDDSYIDGIVYKTGNDAFTFPVGGTDAFSDSHYAGIGISAPANTSSVFTAKYNAEGHSSANTFQAPLTKVSLVEYWNLERAVGSDNIDLTLYWGNGDRSGIGNLSELRIAHWNGTTWENIPTPTTSGTTSSGNITVAGVSSFSPFTFGTTNNVHNPLPMELISFTAIEKNKTVDLNWVTASEKDNDYFSLERSKDGIHFSKIGTIKGAGNSNETLHYYYSDANPLSGLSYYRLKQTDFDGKFTYSEIRAITIKENSKLKLSVYPNPASTDDIVNFTLSKQASNIDLSIYNINGAVVYTENLKQTNNIKLRNNLLSKGVYLVIINADETRLYKRIVIK